MVLFLPWFCLALLMRESLRLHGEVYGVEGGWAEGVARWGHNGLVRVDLPGCMGLDRSVA